MKKKKKKKKQERSKRKRTKEKISGIRTSWSIYEKKYEEEEGKIEGGGRRKYKRSGRMVKRNREMYRPWCTMGRLVHPAGYSLSPSQTLHLFTNILAEQR